MQMATARVIPREFPISAEETLRMLREEFPGYVIKTFAVGLGIVYLARRMGEGAGRWSVVMSGDPAYVREGCAEL